MGEKKEIQDAERRWKSPGLASANVIPPSVTGKGLLGNIDDAGYTTGHDTDAGQSQSGKKRPKLKKRSKASGLGATDVGYDTDEGYMSSSQQRSLGKAKGKSPRFFMLGNRDRSGFEPEMSSSNPEPPPPPVFRTPIAARFATTLGNLDAPSVVESPPRSRPLHLATSPSHLSLQRETRKPEALVDTSVSPIKRRGLHFGSDTDHSGSRSPSIFSFSRSGSSSSSLTSHSHAGSKVPLISLPITRSSSPPPQSPPQLRTSSLNRAGTKHVPDLLSLSTHSANLLGDSPIGSPFALSTQFSLSPSEPSPSKRNFFNRAVEDLVKPKTRNDKDIALRSDPASIPGSSSDMSLQRTRSPPALAVVIPQQRVARRSPQSEEPLLNTYSYYELPPPSPPLDKPVPPLPAMPSCEPAVTSSPKRRKLRPQRMMSSSTSRPTSPIDHLGATSPVSIPLRGRESPFPSRPVLPPSTVGPTSRMTIGHVPGLEVRRTMSATRYRDPQRASPPVGEGRRSMAPQTYRAPNCSRPSGYYSDGPATTAPATSNNFHRAKHGREGQRAPASPLERYGLRFEAGSLVLDDESDDDGRGISYDQDVDDDIRAVANLYNAGSRQAHRDESAGGLCTSYGAVPRSLDETKSGLTNSSSPASHYDSDDRSHYPEDEANAAGDRSTVYSIISYYSSGNLSLAENRSSFMDGSKSEQSRERFVRRIEAMYDANGRELPPRDFIPPVPKLPQGLVTNGIRSGGWF